MNKVNISDLARLLADKKVLGQMEAELFIRKMFDVVNEGLEGDKMVKVKWLGTFKVQAVKDRESVDVNTGDRIVIEGRDKISFTPDNILKEIINKPFAQFETVVVNDGVDFENIDKKFEQMEEENGVDDRVDDLVEDMDQRDTEQSESPVAEEPIITTEIPNPESISNETALVENIEPESATIEKLETEQTVEKAEPEQPAEKKIETDTSEGVDTEPALVEKTVHEMVVPEPSTPKVTEEQMIDSQTFESENIDKHHFILPRYVVVLAVLVIVVLMSGIGYFAFNFGKMQAQRDELALQLKQYHVPKNIARKSVSPKQTVSSQEEILCKKALEDSARLAKEAEAVKVAEEASKRADNQAIEAKENLLSNKKTAEMAGNKKVESASNKKVESVSLKNVEGDASAKNKYDKDPRVRTGAYRIVGVQQVVTAKAGQSLAVLSNRYLGPGMECYLEALNGSSPLKEGQKVKIPKLELKKKK